MNTSDPSTPDMQLIEALRETIRTGVTAATNLEDLPLVNLPIVIQQAGEGATAAKRAYVFIETLRYVIHERLEGKEAQIAIILFGFEQYAGAPIQERYRAVAKLYSPYGTWENYRKEPLTRQLQTIVLALQRETELSRSTDVPKHHVHTNNKVLIVQNITYEGPGLLRRLLEDTAIPYEVVNLDAGEVFPDPTRYAALVVLGGPDSANDTTPKITAQLERVEQALDAGIPFLGICLGLQAAVKVAGGKVVKSVKEVGLHMPDGTPYSVSLTELALTALGKKDPLFLGLRNEFRVFQLHGETVEMTKSMQLLATGRDCRNQIVKIRSNAYGIQSHFELTGEMLQEWLRAHPDLTPLDSQKIMTDFKAMEEVYTITGLSLLRNFLHIAGLL